MRPKIGRHLSPKSLSAFGFPHIANAVGFVVLEIVTVLTQSNAICHIKSQFGVVGKRFDVMGAQISTCSIAAFLAGVTVADKDGGAPIGVFDLTPVVPVAFGGTILPCVVILPSGRSYSGDRRDRQSLLGSSGYALSWIGAPLVRPTHRLFSLSSVYSPLKGGDTPLKRRIRSGRAPADHTYCRETVTAMSVNCEKGTVAPLFARVAPFKATRKIVGILLRRYAEALSCYLECSRPASHMMSLRMYR